MASPQTENGYTPIANELLEAIYKSPFNATQLKIVLTLCRYTYGFSRKECSISEAFISKAIDMSKKHTSSELNKLIESGVLIIVRPHTDKEARILALNKNYDAWFKEGGTVVPQGNNTSTGELQTPAPGEQYFHTPESEINDINADEHSKINNIRGEGNNTSTGELQTPQENNIYIKTNNKTNIVINAVDEILNHWNSKGIVNHKLTPEMKVKITTALKKHSKDTIIKAIDNYTTILQDDSYYYSHKWRLDNFLKQSNGLPNFLEDGQQWINYIAQNNNGGGGNSANRGNRGHPPGKPPGETRGPNQSDGYGADEDLIL